MWNWLLFGGCPACGGSMQGHGVRTLARERWAADKSAVESCLERHDFAAAAAWDDACVLGDQLVHQVIRCGNRIALVTSEDPVGFGREARVRRMTILEGDQATTAWSCAR